jgi:hypothetical protein
MSCYIKANLFLLFDCGKCESRLTPLKVMPIDVNLDILSNLYDPKTHVLVLDLIKRMTTTPRQLCIKRCGNWEHRSESLWDHIGNI